VRANGIPPDAPHPQENDMPHPWSPMAKITALALACVLSGCGPAVPEVVRIGVAQPLSGPSAARGQDILDGVNMAAAELNAAGFKIAGKPVKFEVVARDDKADKDTARKVAQELVDLKVNAVVGHLSSDVTEVTIPIYKQGNVPQFFTSSATELSQQGGGNTFRLVANDGLQAQAVSSYVAESLRATSVAMIYEDTAFGKPMSKDVAASLAKRGTTVRANDAVDNKTVDFKAFVARLKAEPVDVVVAVLRDNQVLPLLQQMQEAGLGRTTVVSTNSSKTDKLAKGPVNVERLFVTSGAADAREFIAGRDFLKKFSDTYQHEPVWAAHYAYDIVHVIASTMNRADSVSPEVVRQKLRSMELIAPVTSTMRFDGAGEQRYGAISVYQRRTGRRVPVMRSDRW
jgi:branched-chain amino acid transport system substrate-binding protein